jgi:tRNA(Met) cytidine acetyltransferase
VLCGSAAWTLVAAGEALSHATAGKTVWLSERDLHRDRLPIPQGGKLLGSEVDTLVYDAHSGFDPDSFGAALGALRGGGLLLLLTPPLEHWPEVADPQASRIAVHPFGPERVGGRFLRRLVRVLTSSPGVIIGTPGGLCRSLASITGPPASPSTDSIDECRTQDQRCAVDAILKTANGRGRRPLVLKSDRGRGKTSALGIAAARILGSGRGSILVTAPRRSAIDPLFRHASRLLPDARVYPNRICNRGARLEFLAPDRLCTTHPGADLLLVDEAAGIPAPMLEQLLLNNPRVVFATTVHGYEGTGRGFDIRFRRTLDALTPSWREMSMETPVRWAPDDPLERLASAALLLDAAPAGDASIAEARPVNCRFRCLDRDSLAYDETMLSQLFGLLVLAHYQTRPIDLRHLLDGPNIRVYALLDRGQVVATALVAIEGGIEPDLGRAIFEGRRRPRGHLLAQTLCAHAGLEEAVQRRYARVIRIAVHPTVQGRGLGRSLLEGIVDDARGQGLDLVGSSFGATKGLVAFWSHCGFAAAHLGTRRNASSGAHAAVVLRSLSPAGDSLIGLARARLGDRLPSLLAGPLRDLEPEIAGCLLRNAPGPSWSPARRERRELESFAFALRPYESVAPLVGRLAGSCFGEAVRAGALAGGERNALVVLALQHRGWDQAALLLGLTGKAQIVGLLRRAVGKLLETRQPTGSHQV